MGMQTRSAHLQIILSDILSRVFKHLIIIHQCYIILFIKFYPDVTPQNNCYIKSMLHLICQLQNAFFNLALFF